MDEIIQCKCGSKNLTFISGLNWLYCQECDADAGIQNTLEEAVQVWNKLNSEELTCKN